MFGYTRVKTNILQKKYPNNDNATIRNLKGWFDANAWLIIPPSNTNKLPN